MAKLGHLRTAAIVTAGLCLAACSEATHTQVQAEAPQIVTVPQPTTKCEVVKKNKKGEPETTSCTTVNVTLPAQTQTTCVLPNDGCSDENLSWFSWKWLKCNASAVSALCALFIGLMTLVINHSVRRGQIAHDQVQTLLEIDTQLVERPELWAVHGKTYLPPGLQPAPDLDALITKVNSATKEEKEKAAQALAQVFDIPSMEKQRRRAFAARYFNFFDILYASYAPVWWKPWSWIYYSDWKVWKGYMTDFFKENTETVHFWNEFAGKGIYSKRFINFIAKIPK